MKLTNYFLLFSFFFTSLSLFSQSYEWGGRFGGAGEDVIKKMHVDADGNSYLTGYFTDTADFDINGSEYNLNSNGFYDVFVQKTNTEGNLEWAVSIGGLMFDYGTGITTDDMGNVYITGYFEETVDFNPGALEFLLTSQGSGDIFILKLSSDGEFIWAKSVGGTGYEESTSIDVDELGNVYILGYLYETVDFDPGLGEMLLTSNGGSDTFLLQLNNSGDFVKVYGYGGDDLDLALDMAVKNSNEIFISGFFGGTTDLDPRPNEVYEMTSLDGFSGYSMKIDGLGNISNIATTEGGDVTVYAIAYDTDNNMYLTGRFSNTVNFDPTSGNSDYTFTSDVAYNGFILKINEDGTVAWARHLGSNDSFFAYDIALGNDGTVYTTGFFDGTADFNPDPIETFLLTKESENATGAYVLTLDAEGIFKSAYQFGGVNFIDTHQLGIDSDNNIYLAAQFETTVDLNPLPDEIDEVIVVDFRDNYLLKMKDGVLSTQFIKTNNISFYPNPVDSELHIKSNTDLIGESYAIYNVVGQQISAGVLLQSQKIMVDTLESGLYILSFSNNLNFKFVRI